MEVHIRQIYVSPGHNYFGHHGQPAGLEPTVEVNCIQCVAGRGIEGDRFFDFKTDYKGQITFFAWEDFEAIKEEFNLPDLSAGAFRRNVLIEGVKLAELEGCRFELQGISFEGTGEAKPCYWMNQAIAPGAEAALLGRGGLRARILRNGTLSTGIARLLVQAHSISPVSGGATAPI
ncbi:MAG: molybdenum cofactor biosysynthesis protein [Cephaloticoccus sp.]|nr:molybdenum cofactor biosysynthesis protein [Cephaloticoccus sp.]